jgi:hypothetical protein
MLYLFAIVLGFFLGIIVESWAHKLPTPPLVSHDRCEERYETLMHRHQQLQREYAHAVNTREEEIQRLVRGAS